MTEREVQKQIVIVEKKLNKHGEKVKNYKRKLFGLLALKQSMAQQRIEAVEKSTRIEEFGAQ